MAISGAVDEERPPTEADRALRAVVTFARSQRHSFSEAVSSVTGRELALIREALLRRCVRSLRCIADALVSAGQEPDVDVCPAREDYDARLTFSALDLFLACAAEVDPCPSEHAHIVFTAFAASGQPGLFVMREAEPDAPPFLVGGYSIDSMTLREAIIIARCAAELCRPWPMQDMPKVEPSCVVFHNGEDAWVCVPGRSGIALLRQSGSSKAESLISWALSRSTQS
jgi:hypothetical protein